jgi:hypothetical protein
MDTLSKKQIFKLQETLYDFLALLPRYREVRDNEEKLTSFCIRNRNPLWDVTNCKFFRTGLLSEEAKKLNTKELVNDHYIQRSKAVKFIFCEIEKDQNISLENFINLVKKYCSTVKLSKNEHYSVTSFAKKNKTYLNYETYLACGIKIEGLSDFILK